MDVLDIIPGIDAVFLPGRIHGCEWQAYIVYLNAEANEGNGSFEIEIIDKNRILDLYKSVNGNAQDFFGILPDLFHGEWYYCNSGTEEFEEYAREYNDADFIFGRDGDEYDEMMFLVNWANSVFS